MKRILALGAALCLGACINNEGTSSGEPNPIAYQGSSDSGSQMNSSAVNGSSSSSANKIVQSNKDSKDLPATSLLGRYLATPYPEVDEFIEQIKDTTIVVDTVGCGDNEIFEDFYMKETPIYMDYETYKSAFRNFARQDFVNAGKVYQLGNMRAVNEVDKGVHIFEKVGEELIYRTFFKIPGNKDIAIRGDYLYADSYNHLAVIDVSNPAEISLVTLLPKVLDDEQYYWGHPRVTEDNEFLYGYQKEPTLRKSCWMYKVYMAEPMVMASMEVDVAMEEMDAGQVVEGQGGSLARFAFGKEYLFYADDSDLKSFDISNPSLISEGTKVKLEWGIETIFDADSLLFVGSQRGTFIVDIKMESRPVLLSEFEHARSCDPIVVENGTAYVTLSSGTACWNGNNQLDILDVSDPSEPSLIQSYPMTHPQGLAVKNEILYLCDGERGLVSYDVSNPKEIVLLGQNKEQVCTDVILSPGEIFAFGPKGTMLYDVTNPEDLRLVEFIEIDYEDPSSQGYLGGGPMILIEPMPFIEEDQILVEE